MKREVVEMAMQYTEVQYLEDGEIVATERVHDDHSYEELSRREPTPDEMWEYFGVDLEGMKMNPFKITGIIFAWVLGIISAIVVLGFITMVVMSLVAAANEHGFWKVAAEVLLGLCLVAGVILISWGIFEVSYRWGDWQDEWDNRNTYRLQSSFDGDWYTLFTYDNLEIATEQLEVYAEDGMSYKSWRIVKGREVIKSIEKQDIF